MRFRGVLHPTYRFRRIMTMTEFQTSRYSGHRPVTGMSSVVRPILRSGSIGEQPEMSRSRPHTYLSRLEVNQTQEAVRKVSLFLFLSVDPGGDFPVLFADRDAEAP